MTFINFLFNLDSILLIALIILVGLLIYFKKRNRLLDYGLALILTSGISEIFKYYINKPRPESMFLFEGSSFPSTHSASAAVIVFFYIFVCHSLSEKYSGIGEAFIVKIKPNEWVVIALIAILGTLIAWLRVILGAHYPVDVFAGIILGFVISSIFVFYDVSGRRVR